MPKEVLQQIQYLCKNIAKVEWSGALFYTTEGSIVNPDTFSITLKTILPLDMGSSAYTEYDLDGRFIDFIEEDFAERSTWKLGQIHSHHSMKVFFSGTDMAELNDNAPAHNFYLSLIVNNYMDFLAKVAFVGEAKSEIGEVPYLAKDSLGNDYVIQKNNFEINTQKLFVYDCAIISPKDTIEVSEQFQEQVKEIMKPKPTKEVFGNHWTKNQAQTPINKLKVSSDPFENWQNPLNIYKEDEREEMDGSEHLAIYNFATNLFNSGISNGEIDFEEAVEELIDFGATPSEIARGVIDNYATIFNQHFPKATEKDFIYITENLLDFLNDYSLYFPEIDLTIKTITEMITKFKGNGKRHNTTK